MINGKSVCPPQHIDTTITEYIQEKYSVCEHRPFLAGPRTSRKTCICPSSLGQGTQSLLVPAYQSPLVCLHIGIRRVVYFLSTKSLATVCTTLQLL